MAGCSEAQNAVLIIECGVLGFLRGEAVSTRVAEEDLVSRISLILRSMLTFRRRGLQS